MRVKVRRILDVDKSVNLRKLAPNEKIKAGFLVQWHQTKTYQRFKQRADEELYRKQVKADEALKSLLLANLYGELSKNSTMSEKGKECDEIVLTVNYKFIDSLHRLFPNLFGEDGEVNKDFLAFNIELVDECEDIRRAFPDMPVLLRCSKLTV